ncbi:hypothetical protein LTR70_002322 [Exophiala xenobiotica]|nr:hypothetical protein LTR70_002322 [Exophiala xenobiotica]
MFDNLDLFNTGKNEHMSFMGLPDAALPECEYLGVSKLQFSSGPVRHHQPRPIRSASERSPISSASGSPKDEPVERTKNNPRNDPRYDVKADKNGLYHCPYVGTEGCTHKPTKQKCIYAKNLDSHLKPYTCKHGVDDETCRGLRFSSNACLFRHEREMHGMHNHGINPYLCKFPGCERARHDNGFPRRWNQRDHMKRVHGWEEPDNDNETSAAYADAPRRRKGPGASSSVAMKRTGSARAQANYSYGPRNVSAPRYTAQMQRELQAHNIMIPDMIVDPANYGPQQMMTQAYGPGPIYMQSTY